MRECECVCVRERERERGSRRAAWSVLSARGREIFVGNLLIRVHSIIEMILEDRPCAMRL